MFLLELRHIEVEYTGIQGIRHNQYKQWSITLLIVTLSFHSYFLAHGGLTQFKTFILIYMYISAALEPQVLYM